MSLARWLLFGLGFTAIMGLMVFVLALLSAAAEMSFHSQEERKWDL